jgi:hypothetical protein
MELILIIAGSGILLILVITALNIRYRRMVKEKNHGIFRHIKEQNQLKKELEYINMEKQIMEKMLSSKFDTMILLGTEKKTSEL